MIRNAEENKSLQIPNNEHKIIQYADDATICVRDLDSIKCSISVINKFCSYAGLKLNIKNTKRIWLGSFKDLDLLKYETIKWTGTPVKCVGIYILGISAIPLTGQT